MCLLQYKYFTVFSTSCNIYSVKIYSRRHRLACHIFPGPLPHSLHVFLFIYKNSVNRIYVYIRLLRQQEFEGAIYRFKPAVRVRVNRKFFYWRRRYRDCRRHCRCQGYGYSGRYCMCVCDRACRCYCRREGNRKSYCSCKCRRLRWCNCRRNRRRISGG